MRFSLRDKETMLVWPPYTQDCPCHPEKGAGTGVRMLLRNPGCQRATQSLCCEARSCAGHCHLPQTSLVLSQGT